MSEQNNDNGTVDTQAEVAPVENVEAAVEQTEPETVPKEVFLSRINEIIAQREAERAERERVAYELQTLKQQLAAQQPRTEATTEAPFWEKYQDPNTRAYAKLQYEAALEAQKVANRGIEARLARQEAQLEKQEALDFWSRYPQVPAELKQKTEQIFANAKHMGVDRDTALTFAYGEMQRAQLSGSVANAAASVTQQSAVNRVARPAMSTGAVTNTQQPKPQTAAEIAAQIEKEHARLLKG